MSGNRITLRSYQEADVKRIVEKKRVLNMSNCGLGKTVVATRAIEAVGAYPCLIAVPGYLADTWHDHLIAEGHPESRIVVAATVASRIDPHRPKNPPAQRAVGPEEKQALLDTARAPRVHWVIVNYETTRRKPAVKKKSVDRIWEKTANDLGIALTLVQSPAPAVRERSPHTYRMPPVRSIVMDESHRLRGHRSQQFRGVYQVASLRRCELAIELTATPIYRDVGDLYAQLRILDPRRFRSYWRFLEEYALLDEDPWGTRIIGYRPEALRLLADFSIAREYADPEVGLELPPIISRNIIVSMSPKSVAEYGQVKYHDRTRAGELIVDSGTRITELRAITAHDENKLQALKDLVEDIEETGYIVFCHYRETARLVGRMLGIPVVLGGEKDNTGKARRAGRLGFSWGIAATIDCLQEGIDLSHLQTVIFYEADYLPGKHKQAMMRVQRWRPGGDNTTPVLLYHFSARGTIDRHIRKVCEDRGADANELMRMEMS